MFEWCFWILEVSEANLLIGCDMMRRHLAPNFIHENQIKRDEMTSFIADLKLALVFWKRTLYIQIEQIVSLLISGYWPLKIDGIGRLTASLSFWNGPFSVETCEIFVGGNCNFFGGSITWVWHWGSSSQGVADVKRLVSRRSCDLSGDQLSRGEKTIGCFSLWMRRGLTGVGGGWREWHDMAKVSYWSGGMP